MSIVGALVTASKDDDDGGDWRNPAFVFAAAELGFWGCGGTQLNSLGLQDVSAVKATLLLASVNILTPLLQALFGAPDQRDIAPRTWAACLLALACTIFAVEGDQLLAPSTATSAAAALSGGDGLVLAAATCYAMQKVRLGTLVRTFPAQALAAGRLQTQAAISFAILGGSSALASVGGGEAAGDGAAGGDATAAALASALSWSSQLTPPQLVLLLLSALLPGAFATLLQAEGQQVVPAAAAQPIYAAMPIFAAGWAALLLHEPITTAQTIGGLGTCAAAVLATTGGANTPVVEEAASASPGTVGRVVPTAAASTQARKPASFDRGRKYKK